jgi:hypothetical protein
MTRGPGIAICARYPARNPREGEPSGAGEGGWIIASAVDGVAVIIGYLRAGWGPGGLGQHQRLDGPDRGPGYRARRPGYRSRD